MNSIEIDVANYPEAVALTGILVSEHWQRKVAPHDDQRSSWAADSAGQQFYAEVSRRLKISYQVYSYDPLATWVDHTRRSHLLQLAHTARQEPGASLPLNMSHRRSEPD